MLTAHIDILVPDRDHLMARKYSPQSLLPPRTRHLGALARYPTRCTRFSRSSARACSRSPTGRPGAGKQPAAEEDDDRHKKNPEACDVSRVVSRVSRTASRKPLGGELWTLQYCSVRCMYVRELRKIRTSRESIDLHVVEKFRTQQPRQQRLCTHSSMESGEGASERTTRVTC